MLILNIFREFLTDKKDMDDFYAVQIVVIRNGAKLSILVLPFLYSGTSH
tara:strand:- start:2026 stop:2172 length:147 start_codon:yes stop_codon:yes gene_type:complete